MTDHPTPTDDELSLALDGEADAELQARIDASPEAQARLDALRTAAEAVAGATVPPLDEATVDELVSAALDTPVAPQRPASASRKRPGSWLVAAAVILLMAVGLTLVWSGRGTEDDQASAKFETVGASISADGDGSEALDSSFSAGDQSIENGTAASNRSSSETGASTGAAPGGHGSPTTITPSTSDAVPPLLYLGAFADGDALREATAASFADAWKASGSVSLYDSSGRASTSGKQAPSAKAVDRCGDQLQVTLATKAAPIQTGFAEVDGDDVLVYEFAAASAVDGKDTTLVAAVGVDACDEVVIFER